MTPESVRKTIIRLWKAFLVTGLSFLLFIFLVTINFLGLFGQIPGLSDLENPKMSEACQIYSEDGVLYGKLYEERREPVQYDQIAPVVIDALIATEDQRFYEHCGIDAKSMGAIFWYLAKGDKRGGSTITQQLVKNLFKTRRSGSEGFLTKVPVLSMFIYKVKEWVTAIRLEKHFTKKEILNMYLNTVDFGSNAFGIRVASRTFFNTSQDSLTIPQAATLVGLLKATTTYSPVLNPENCIKRRNIVLTELATQGLISLTELELYKKEPIGIDLQLEDQQIVELAPYLKRQVLKFVQEWCRKNDRGMYQDGLVIYTSLNSNLQRHTEESVRKHMGVLHKKFLQHWNGRNPWVYENKKEIPGFLDSAVKKTTTYKVLQEKYRKYPDSVSFYLHQPKNMTVFSWEGEKDTLFSTMDSLRYYKHFLHTGVVLIDPASGQVKAWVGGIHDRYFFYDHVKDARRQPGSSFKPFVYAAAMENGFTPCDRIMDKRVTIRYKENGEMKSWTPQNADWVFTGENMTLRKAMARSINSVAATLMQEVGTEKVIDCAKRLGITSSLASVPSLALGSSDVSVLEMASAYAAFVNKGVWIEPHFVTRIEDRQGNVLYEANPVTYQAISEENAYSMIHMLVGGTEIAGGTSQALLSFDIFRRNQIGGKTGTTSNYSDGWFIGVTKDLVGGVWVGGEDRCIHFTTSSTGEGSKTALPVFGKVMEKVYADTSLNITPGYFDKPENYSIDVDCVDLPADTVETVSDSLLMKVKEEIF